MPTLDRPRPTLSGLLLLLGGLLSGCASSAAGLGDELFERYEVLTGAARPQTVVTGFFLGGAVADLAVVERDESGAPRLRVYAFGDRTWEPRFEVGLEPGLLFVDVAAAAGRDRLLAYRRGRLSWLDPATGAERPLAELAIDYDPAHDLEGSASRPGGAPPRVDVTRDLNRDGRDDLLVPDVDGFWVAIQRDDGSFTEPVQLGPPEPFRDERVGNLGGGEGAAGAERTYGELGITAATLPQYLSRVHEIDYDLDGRSDLVFWNRDHFEVHRQGDDGLFDREPESFAPGVPFDSDGVYSHAFEFRDQGVAAIVFGAGEKTRGTVLHSLRDLDGDAVADLVTLTLSGRSIAKQRSLYEVHFGASTPEGVEFAREAGTAIRPRGRAGAMQPWGYSSQWLEDFDGDGRVDVLFRDVNVGVGGMMRALVGKSVPITIELYRNQDGAYPDEPTTRRKIRRFAPFAGMNNVFFPPVLMGDVNGDGRADLLVGKSPKELHVFLGVPGPELLAPRPRKVAVALPSDERRTRLVDLDRDGKQDLLIHRAPTERAPGAPNRVTLLIAR